MCNTSSSVQDERCISDACKPATLLCGWRCLCKDGNFMQLFWFQLMLYCFFLCFHDKCSHIPSLSGGTSFSSTIASAKNMQYINEGKAAKPQFNTGPWGGCEADIHFHDLVLVLCANCFWRALSPSYKITPLPLPLILCCCFSTSSSIPQRPT